MTRDEEAIRTLLDAWYRALADSDRSTLLSLVTEDVAAAEWFLADCPRSARAVTCFWYAQG